MFIFSSLRTPQEFSTFHCRNEILSFDAIYQSLEFERNVQKNYIFFNPLYNNESGRCGVEFGLFYTSILFYMLTFPNKKTKQLRYWCFYSHRSRESVSPVRRIFLMLFVVVLW